MTRLTIRYAPFQNSLEPLYEVVDLKDGTRYADPKPWHEAERERKYHQALIDARQLEDFAVAAMMGAW